MVNFSCDYAVRYKDLGHACHVWLRDENLNLKNAIIFIWDTIYLWDSFSVQF